MHVSRSESRKFAGEENREIMVRGGVKINNYFKLFSFVVFSSYQKKLKRILKTKTSANINFFPSYSIAA